MNINATPSIGHAAAVVPGASLMGVERSTAPTQQVMGHNGSAPNTATSCAPNLNEVGITVGLVVVPTVIGVAAGAACNNALSTLPGAACATPQQAVGHWCCVGTAGLSAAIWAGLCVAACACACERNTR
jgi:hypothetical protein